MEISVFVQGLNEGDQLPRLFSPLKGIDDIVFIDHGSTDNSIKIAKKLGARVFSREFLHDIVNKDDVKDFIERFGYEPQFVIGQKILQANKERSEEQKLCKNDWVLNLDCDEIITWDIEKVKAILPDKDVINCKFFHYRTPEGGRTDWFQTSKLYNRTKTFWIGRIHEVINGYDLRVGWSDDMEIDHLQKIKPNRKSYEAQLEYAVLRDMDARPIYYLAKEYHHVKKWEKAIKFFILYLRESFYKPERVKAYLYIADCLFELCREDEAWVYAFQALKLNPESQEAFLFLSKLAPQSEKSIWLKHAELAVNDHLI